MGDFMNKLNFLHVSRARSLYLSLTVSDMYIFFNFCTDNFCVD